MNTVRGWLSRHHQLLRFGGSVFSIALLVYLLTRQGWSEITRAFLQIPVRVFVLVAVAMIISRFAVSGRWYALLRVTDQEATWRKTVYLTFAGLFATNFLPTTIGGDVVRVAGAVQYGINVSVATASVVIDRLIGLFGMALMVPFGVWPFITAGQATFRFPPVQLTIVLPLHRLWYKTLEFLQRILTSVHFWRQRPVSLLESLVFTFIHMFCFFCVIWGLFWGLNDPMPFILVAGLYSLVYFITLLPISINGYGVQEISISLIFSQVGGVSMQHTLTVALIFRTLTMLASLPGAIFVPGIIAGHRGEAVEDMDSGEV